VQRACACSSRVPFHIIGTALVRLNQTKKLLGRHVLMFFTDQELAMQVLLIESWKYLLRNPVVQLF